MNKLLLTITTGLLSCAANAQTAHVWSHDFETTDASSWGSAFNNTFQNLNGTTGTTTEKRVVDHGVFTPGIGDETIGAAVASSAGHDYAFTGVNSSSYNINTTGDSLTLDIWWVASEISDAVNPATAVNEIAQIGITSASSGILGAVDSLYVAVLELSSETALGSSQTDYLLKNDNAGIVSTLESNKQTYHFTPVNAITAAYHYQMTFTNKGSGLMDLSLDIDLWEHEGNSDYFVSVDPNFANYSVNNFTHGLNDLTNLSPALGIRVQDSANVSISGTTYDSLTTTTVVPEPNTAALAALSFFAFTLRRKK